MKIITTLQMGLPFALDLGLAHSRSMYVARMDADDICQSGRLGKQINFLEAHKHIHVLGGQAVIITNSEEHSQEASRQGSNYYDEEGAKEDSQKHSAEQTDECGVLAGMFPTHPVLLHWGMFFKCCLIHPTVMFRRDIIVECGGYSGTFRGQGTVPDSGTLHTSDSIDQSSAQARTDAIDSDVSSCSDVHTVRNNSTSHNRICSNSSGCSSSIGNNDSRPYSDEKSVKSYLVEVEEDCSEVELIEDYALWQRILLR